MDILAMIKKSLLVLFFISMQVVAMEIDQELECLQRKRMQLRMQLAEQTCRKHEKLTNDTIDEINQRLLDETDFDERFELEADLNYFHWQRLQHEYMKKELGVITVGTIIGCLLVEHQSRFARGIKRGFHEIKEGQVVVAPKRRKLGGDGSYEGQYLL